MSLATWREAAWSCNQEIHGNVISYVIREWQPQKRKGGETRRWKTRLGDAHSVGRRPVTPTFDPAPISPHLRLCGDVGPRRKQPLHHSQAAAARSDINGRAVVLRGGGGGRRASAARRTPHHTPRARRFLKLLNNFCACVRVCVCSGGRAGVRAGWRVCVCVCLRWDAACIFFCVCGAYVCVCV